MRRKRYFVMGREVVQHVFCRTAGKVLLFGEAVKERIVEILLAEAKFHGVRVLDFTVLDNHFHVEVELLERKPMTDEELLEAYGAKYGEGGVMGNFPDVEQMGEILRRGGERAQWWRDYLWKRTGTIPGFMKDFKQRVTQYYNTLTGHVGTIWEGRYRHCMVEGSETYRRVLSGYIGLNAVRAGLVEDPEQYRFCGLYHAMEGNEELRKALREMYGEVSWEEARQLHRLLMTGSLARRGADRDGRTREAEALMEELCGGGKRPMKEIVRHADPRFLRDGQVVGSPEFIEWVLEQHPGMVPAGRKRRCTKVGFVADDEPWYSLREIRARPLEPFA